MADQPWKGGIDFRRSPARAYADAWKAAWEAEEEDSLRRSVAFSAWQAAEERVRTEREVQRG